MPRALDPRRYTNELFARTVTPAPGQRILTLGVAASVVAAWTGATGATGATGQVGASGAVVAVERWLPDWRALEVAARRSGGALRAIFAATLEPLGDDTFDLCAIDIAAFASNKALLALTEDALAHLTTGGVMLAAGPKNAGILSFSRRLEAWMGNAETLAYRKGQRIVAARRPDQLAIVSEREPPVPHTVVTHGLALTLLPNPGVFAGGLLDEASAMLAGALDIAPGARCLDLGCGAGILGMVAARLAPGRQVTLVDADAAALETARLNCAANGVTNARILPSDGVDAIASERFDVVVCNPPFHQRHQHSSALADRFMRDARSVLGHGGQLWFVANRFLPYESRLAALFDSVREVAGDDRYKVLRASVESA